MTRRARTALAAALLALTPALAACSTGEGDDAAAAEAAAVAFDGAHVGEDAFAAALDEPGVTLVDVRTPAEYAQGHLPGAVLIDINAPDFADRVAELDAEGAYAVYCRSANRSRAAISVMADAGVDQTIGLEGGISAWSGDVVTGE